MYESPVEITFDQTSYTSLENEVFNVIQKAAVGVDREELMRALKYDRDQYKKGYADGRADAIREIMTWIQSCPVGPDVRKGVTYEQ